MNTAKRISMNRENTNLRLIQNNGSRTNSATLDRQRRWSMVAGSALFTALFALGASSFMDLGSFYAASVYVSLWVTLSVAWSNFQELYGHELKFSFRSAYAWPTVIGFAFTAFIFYAVGTGSRLPAEESYWTAVSQTLHQTSSLGNGRGAALFPFFASLFHSLFGYREQHLFWVNFVACGLLLASVVRFGDKQFKNRAFGVITVALLASFPLFGILATANNPDFLNALLLTATAYQLYRFFQTPTLTRLEFASVLTILAAQARPSSFFFMVPLCFAAYQNRKRLLAERPTLRTIALPLLCLPVAAMVNANHFVLNSFSPGYLMENIGEAVGFFINAKNTFLLSSQIFSLVALASMAVLASQWQRLTKQDPQGIKAIGFVGLGLAAVTIGQYGFDQGDISSFATARLVMVYLPLLALAAAYPVYRLYQRGEAAPVVALLVIANLCYQMPTHTRKAVHQAAGTRVESVTRSLANTNPQRMNLKVSKTRTARATLSP